MTEYPDKYPGPYTRDEAARQAAERIEHRNEGAGSMWFILGGLVVAVAALAVIFANFDSEPAAPAPAVTIETAPVPEAGGQSGDQMAPPVAEPSAPEAGAAPAPETGAQPAPPAGN